MRRPFEPEEEILHYCEHIMNRHIQTVRSNKRSGGTWYWDFPAIAAICHDSGCYVKRASYSHYPQKNEYHPILKQKLQELGGDIGERSNRPGWRFVIGSCAEQHAANIFMKQCEEENLNNLYFSVPMRPRTKQTFPYCENCKDTFPNL